MSCILKSCSRFSPKKHASYGYSKALRYERALKFWDITLVQSSTSMGSILAKNRGGLDSLIRLIHIVVSSGDILWQLLTFGASSFKPFYRSKFDIAQNLNVYSAYNNETKLSLQIQLNQNLTKIILIVSNYRCAIYI